MKENKKKRQKAEDFIGWKSPDGKLEVVGIAGKQGNSTTFKVTCTKCSQDQELFPDGYFVSHKGCLVRGTKPCGCAFNPKWKPWQYLILARRAGEGRFVVHGFAEEVKNQKTKLNLECLKDGYKWAASIQSVINNGSGCPSCAGQYKPTEKEALQKCVEICDEMNYEAVGFLGGYNGAHKTRFEYVCITHGKREVSYHGFVNKGRRCRGCWKDRQLEIVRDSGNGNGYYAERKDETDFLYILNFNDEFIKVGRSFDIKRRLSELQIKSGISNIIKLRIFTATHQEIYDTEQEIHNELREHNFQHDVYWSTECFEKGCLFILNKLLDISSLEEVYFV